MSLKILIRGLPLDFDEDELLELCEEFGEVTATGFMPNARSSRRAWVEYSEEWEAECALGELDGAAIEESYLEVTAYEADDDDDGPIASDDDDDDDDEVLSDDEDDLDDDDYDDEDEGDDDWSDEDAAEEF
jgi:RNA recognition motif-containing protein